MKHIARALRHRNFRLFFAGQTVSVIGTWMQQVAMSWLVFRLTGSPFLLGLTAFSGQIPVLLFAPLAGTWSDRFDRRRLLLLTQTAAMLQAFALAGLVYSGAVAVWHIVAMAAVLGVINAVDVPVRQSFVVRMVDSRHDLPNAIALNSFIMNLSRFLGPSLAGVLIGLLGEAACFLVNGFSYVAVVAALLAMKIKPEPERGENTGGVAEGLRYAFGFPPIRALLMLVALVSFAATPYVALMPIYASHVFHGDARTLGTLLGYAGLGAIAGTLFLASRRTVRGLGTIIAYASSCAGVALMAFAFSTAYRLSLLLLVLIGFGVIVTAASSNMIVQTVVEDRVRGRVMALYAMSFLGMAPLGSLAAGVLASYIGAPPTLFLGGAACLAGGLIFARALPDLRRHIRPIYVKLGIIPSVE